jgi:hypothetical protein
MMTRLMPFNHHKENRLVFAIEAPVPMNYEVISAKGHAEKVHEMLDDIKQLLSGTAMEKEVGKKVTQGNVHHAVRAMMGGADMQRTTEKLKALGTAVIEPIADILAQGVLVKDKDVINKHGVRDVSLKRIEVPSPVRHALETLIRSLAPRPTST